MTLHFRGNGCGSGSAMATTVAVTSTLTSLLQQWQQQQNLKAVALAVNLKTTHTLALALALQHPLFVYQPATPLFSQPSRGLQQSVEVLAAFLPAQPPHPHFLTEMASGVYSVGECGWGSQAALLPLGYLPSECTPAPKALPRQLAHGGSLPASECGQGAHTGASTTPVSTLSLEGPWGQCA